MTILTILKKANGNLLRSKFRSLLTILSVFIGALALSLIMVANQGFQTWIDRQLEGPAERGSFTAVPKGADEAVQINASTVKEYQEGLEGGFMYRNLVDQDINKILKLKNVERVEKRLSDELIFLHARYNDSKKIFSSIGTIYPNNQFALYAGSVPDSTNDKNFLLSYEVAEKMGYNEPKDLLNREIELTFKKDSGELFVKKLNVQGILRNSIIYNSANRIPEKIISEIYKSTVVETTKSKSLGYRSLTVIYKKDLSANEIEDLKAEVKKLDLGVMTNNSYKAGFEQLLSLAQTILTFFSAVALTTGFFGVINTLFTSALEKTKEIGLMRALGMSKRGVFVLFSVEGAMIGFWGAVIGVLTTAITSAVINSIAASNKLFGFENGDVLIVTPANTLIVIGVITLITFIAGIFPALKASRMDPIESLRYE